MISIVFDLLPPKKVRDYRRRQAVTKREVFQGFDKPKIVPFITEQDEAVAEILTCNKDATLMFECIQALKKQCLPCDPTPYHHVPFLWRVKQYRQKETFSIDFRYFWSLFWLLIDRQVGRRCPQCQTHVSCILCLKEIEYTNKCCGCLEHEAICCPGKPMNGKEVVFFACQGCRSTFCYTDIMLSLYGVIKNVDYEVDLRQSLSTKVLQELSRVMQIDLLFCPITGPFTRLEKINTNFVDYLELVLKETPALQIPLKFLQIS